MTDRYEAVFADLAERGEAALVPYLMIGDPTPEVFLDLVALAIESGADALELGIAFSDPLADGPTVQEAAARVLAAGSTPEMAIDLVAQIRDRYPDIPIGLLVYANIAENIDDFAGRCAAAGVDSVLLPDVPLEEDGASTFGGTDVSRVYILPPNADEDLVRRVAQASRGYVYVTSRAGVTGAGAELPPEISSNLELLRAYDAAPAVLGFGISRPEHAAAGAAAGFAGVIVGSALIDVITAEPSDWASVSTRAAQLLTEMKSATRTQRVP